MSEAWRDRYEVALERAAAAAVTASAGARAIACGFTGNVDRVAPLDASLLDALLAGRGIAAGDARVVRARTVDELLAGIVQCVRAGSGIDLPVSDAAVQQWLLDRAPGRSQVGGTGAQAAVTLDRLGFPAILHLTGRSPEQIAALGAGPRMLIATERGPVPASAAVRPGDPVMWHVALEFPAGIAIPATAGGGVAPASDRVIVSHDPVNGDFRIDPVFAETVASAGAAVPAALISGFSQVVDPAALERVLADAAGVLRGWRLGNPALLVHLELGAMPQPDMLPMVLDALAPFVSSVGLNEDELRDVADPEHRAGAFGWPERLAALVEIGERWPAARFGLHTREGCLALTPGDPETERDALLFGSLVAATRAARGGFPSFQECRDTLREADIRPLPQVPLPGAGRRTAVLTPGLLLSRTTAAVGLGDSFTAGLLAMLALG
jgi:ADP-dependent phosphofructokinase/glucokinase